MKLLIQFQDNSIVTVGAINELTELLNINIQELYINDCSDINFWEEFVKENTPDNEEDLEELFNNEANYLNYNDFVHLVENGYIENSDADSIDLYFYKGKYYISPSINVDWIGGGHVSSALSELLNNLCLEFNIKIFQQVAG